jgi:hypothetical protein
MASRVYSRLWFSSPSVIVTKVMSSGREAALPWTTTPASPRQRRLRKRTWRRRPTPAPAVRAFYVVDKPGAPQSVILIGNLGVPRSTPDYYALRVMNNLLGVSFTSRLNQNLREEQQYTYGVASRFDMRLSAGPFVTAAPPVVLFSAQPLQPQFPSLPRAEDSPTA